VNKTLREKFGRGRNIQPELASITDTARLQDKGPSCGNEGIKK